MWFLILAGLALAGCGAAAVKRHRGPFVFQVETDSPLYAPATAAAAAWAEATGLDVRVAPDGDIPIFFVEHLSGCNEAAGDQACSFKGAEGRIEVRSATPAKLLRQLLTHEMGHELRGDGVHLATVDAIMGSPSRAETITPEDVAFICQTCECAG